MADTGTKEYIAKEKTSQDILGRVGSAGDSGSTTVMGKLKDIYDSTVFSAEAKVVSGTLPRGTETTVLSVTGKGVLHSFGQYRRCGTSPSTIKIIADGKTLVNGEMTNTSSSDSGVVYVGNPADVNFVASGSTTKSGVACPFFYAFSQYNQWVSTIGVQKLSATKWTFEKGVLYIPLVSPIAFETSLEIICTGSDTADDQYGCLYELR